MYSNLVIFFFLFQQKLFQIIHVIMFKPHYTAPRGYKPFLNCKRYSFVTMGKREQWMLKYNRQNILYFYNIRGPPMLPIWTLKRLVSVFINARRLLSALPSLSQFGRGRLSLVTISFYVLSKLFGPCRLSEFTLAEPHISFSSGLTTWWQKFAIFIPKNIRSCLAKQGQEVLYMQVSIKFWYKF